ncbi:MAG: zinc ribbon domain-containing protein [Treponema sp.]|nr:zinc ribbon domain-containing protein [Treponema sp.]
MAVNKKKAKFFCENCGEEVPQNARFCKHCGRFFTSVKCPQCGFVGIATAFTKGCPMCGYADGKTNHATPGNTQVNQVLQQHIHYGNTVQAVTDANALPAWIYVLTIGILAGLIIGIFVYI